MKKITTEAWTLRRINSPSDFNGLILEEFTFPMLSDDEVLALPLFGCWEGNMEHSLSRSPLDLCNIRNEEQVVIGNAGVVRIIEVGNSVSSVAEGDICIVFCNGIADKSGYPSHILGYDAPNSMGVLAKKIKLKEKQVITIPNNSSASLEQWAAFSLRYITAWANWRVAYKCWQSQMENALVAESYVAGWGGGVAMAELELAKFYGFNAIMLTSSSERMAMLQKKDIFVIDRSKFSKSNYELDFLDTIMTHTLGKGVDIFVDHIGDNFRSTLKALARQGVLTTSGWRASTTFPIIRPSECINRHIHVFTHYACYQEGLDAVRYAIENNWFPSVGEKVYEWHEIPKLAEDYSKGEIKEYYPIFAINPV
jgi:NADPH:quinone reductase-like Zn-dependent oxidoreductase